MWKAVYGDEADGVDGSARQQPVLPSVEIVPAGERTPADSGARASFVGAPIVALTPLVRGKVGFFVVGLVSAAPRCVIQTTLDRDHVISAMLDLSSQ